MDMDDYTINSDTVLKKHGSALDKDFAKIVSEGFNTDEVELISDSPYIISQVIYLLFLRENSFTVLSILAKFNDLQVILELFTTQNNHFPVICMQKTWLQDETKLPLVSLDGYKCFHVNASSISRLTTYVDDRFNVTVMKILNNSTIWDGLFLELNHDSLHDKVTVGKITIMSITKLLSGRNWNLSCKNYMQQIMRF